MVTACSDESKTESTAAPAATTTESATSSTMPALPEGITQEQAQKAIEAAKAWMTTREEAYNFALEIVSKYDGTNETVIAEALEAWALKVREDKKKFLKANAADLEVASKLPKELTEQYINRVLEIENTMRNATFPGGEKLPNSIKAGCNSVAAYIK